MDVLPCISRLQGDDPVAQIYARAWLACDGHIGFLVCSTAHDIKREPVGILSFGKGPAVVGLDLDGNRIARSSLKGHDFVRKGDVGIYRVNVWYSGVLDLDVVKVESLLVRFRVIEVERPDGNPRVVACSLDEHFGVLPFEVALGLGSVHRVADVGAVFEKSGTFFDFHYQLDIIDISAAGHVGRPVECQVGVHLFAALEFNLRKSQAAMIVGLSEFPVVFLRINDFCGLVEVLIAPGKKFVEQIFKARLGPEVRRFSARIVVTYRVVYFYIIRIFSCSCNERFHPGEVIIEICFKVLVDALVLN